MKITRYQKKLLKVVDRLNAASYHDFHKKHFSIKKAKKNISKLVKQDILFNYVPYNIFLLTKNSSGNTLPKKTVLSKIDKDAYMTEYSAIKFYNMTVDGVFSVLFNSDKLDYYDKVNGMGFKKVNKINKKDYNEIQLLDGTSIKVATPERAFFDFLLTHKDFIVKDGNLEQFGEDSYRFEWVGAVNQNKILEYCRKTGDEDMIYLGEFFGKFIEWYRENKDFSDGFEPYKEYPKMENLKYF